MGQKLRPNEAADLSSLTRLLHREMGRCQRMRSACGCDLGLDPLPNSASRATNGGERHDKTSRVRTMAFPANRVLGRKLDGILFSPFHLEVIPVSGSSQ